LGGQFALSASAAAPGSLAGGVAAGAVVVDSQCRAIGHPSIFAVGGCAAFPVHPALMQAKFAKLQSATTAAGRVARNLSQRQASKQSGGGGGAGRESRAITPASASAAAATQQRAPPLPLAQLTSFENGVEMARFAAAAMVCHSTEGPLSPGKPGGGGGESGGESAASSPRGGLGGAGSPPGAEGAVEAVEAVYTGTLKSPEYEDDDGDAVGGGLAKGPHQLLPVYAESGGGAAQQGGNFAPVPFLSCEMLELSWRFAGTTQGASPVLVGSTQGYPKFFAVVWVRDSHLVGIFLEGAGAEPSKAQRAAQRPGREDARGALPEEVAAVRAQHLEAMRVLATKRPRIINVKKLKKASLEQLLADPFFLEPPPLEPGEFIAEREDDLVYEAFRYHDVSGGGVVKTSSLGPIMSELGADWDDDELAEAEAAMDPAGKGVVPFETFKAWWLN